MFSSIRLLSCLLLTSGVSYAEDLPQWSEEGPITLAGPHVGHQLVLTNTQRDLTRTATYQSVPEGIVEIDSTGYLRPLKNGTATISATVEGNSSQERQVTVTGHGSVVPVGFVNEIVPLFTRHGCNGGSCHGKVGGQNSFRLSLMGFEPEKDRAYLREGLGRRIFRAAPSHSLLVLKGSGQLPHKGGSRLTPGGDDYQTLLRWIGQLGSRTQPASEEPGVERIVVMPPTVVLRSVKLNG